MTCIKLIVGLGNPGSEYANTRHNVGAWLVEELAKQTHQTLRPETKFRGQVGTFSSSTGKCHLIIPSTYMNESGQAVHAICKFYKLLPEEVLVAHDELDFPAGIIRIKKSGGHGGHNGLRDIISHLHSNHFYRLRIGIGHPGHKDRVSPYVLGRPSSQDSDRITHAIQEGINILPDLITGNIEKAQRLLHLEN